jgi:murein DD-endopeptidase MepM/ murein hydrolase activator NlpD
VIDTMKHVRAFIAPVTLFMVLGSFSTASARMVSGGGRAVMTSGRSIVTSDENPLDTAGTVFAKAAKQFPVEDLHELTWPVSDHTINTPFSGGHSGLDIQGETGDPIVAAASGMVEFAGDDGDGYGQKIVIRHDDEISTLYSHLQTIDVSQGSVRRGEQIGTVGCTGSCTGDHLHFEVLINDTPTSPLDYLKS